MRGRVLCLAAPLLLAAAACAGWPPTPAAGDVARFDRFLEFGFGGRYLGPQSVYGSGDEHGVLSINVAGIPRDGLGMEGGAALSFPSLWDTLPREEEPGVSVSTDSFTTELYLGPCWRPTPPQLPLHLRFGVGASWIEAGIQRERTDGVNDLDEETTDSSFGLYGHVTMLGIIDTGTRSVWTIGASVRFLTLTEMDFFGDQFPAQHGSADYFQFQLLFGRAF